MQLVKKICDSADRSSCPSSIKALFIAVSLWALSPPIPTDASENEVCMDCHADSEIVRETEYKPGSSVFVDPELLDASIHEGMDCVECHADASDDHSEQLSPAACADCHEEAVEEYAGSLHGVALARGEGDAPTCADCHGGHQILPSDDPESTAHIQKIPYTCATCHANVDFIERRPVSIGLPLAGYEQSVHFKTLQKGEHGATCTDCHNAHALYKPNDSRSAIHHDNVPRTCGQCHGEIQKVYEQSIHGRALTFGNTDAPNCVDCHGEHEIRRPEDPESMVYPAHISQTTCVWCHESERIVKRYGLASKRLSTYMDSYHGLADRSGSTTVANCASCHGIHDIRPSDEPQSSIHISNLPQTCGQCHPGAGKNFALGSIHVAPGLKNGEHVAVFYVRQIYILLIIVTIGGMLLHNGFDFFKNFKKGRLQYGNDHLRFTLNERLQHGVMALSFMTLAYSGFALKFPDEWWAVPFTWVNGSEENRMLIHRIAALSMVAVCLYHIGYFLLTRRGWEQFKEMLPRIKDVHDVVQRIRYYLGGNTPPPAFARFSYAEKLEYWALVWGSAVMSVTGFALWFENISLQIIPKWGLDVATTIHYYEAWLAGLAILVWHFYLVIFNPRVYPMSLVWLTGRMSEEEMAHEHALELDKIREAYTAEDQEGTEATS